MDIDKLQPYFSMIAAVGSVTAIGFLLRVLITIRLISRDRIEVAKERADLAKERLEYVEKSSSEEKVKYKEKISDLETQLSKILESNDVNVNSLLVGQHIELKNELNDTLSTLLKNFEDLQVVRDEYNINQNSHVYLETAKAFSAKGLWEKAAKQYDEYVNLEPGNWEVEFLRGVAHANSRAGIRSYQKAATAYSTSIVYMSEDSSKDMKARAYSYLGAILKRLEQYKEAESTLLLAREFAKAKYEIEDIHYNLACIYSLTNQKEKMLQEISGIKNPSLKKYLRTKVEYFKNYINDKDFILATS